MRNSKEIALKYLDAGLSICPIAIDGTKRPLVQWADYSKRLPTKTEVANWFDRPAGIGIIGGAVSGNLERIDFDLPGAFKEFMAICQNYGVADLIKTLPLVQTPRDPTCYHIYYRCDEPVGGNMPLAARMIDNKKTTIVETRGEGGYTIAPGSPKSTHKTNNPYILVNGDLTAIPIITSKQRKLLLAIARLLNDVEPPKEPRRRKSAGKKTDGLQPGEDFTARGDWRVLLESSGWKYMFNVGETEHWRRPGKTENSPSATFNHKGAQTFYVFSSNAQPFEQLQSYTPFGIYATLKHDGDFKAAARDLGKQGFGEKIERLPLVTEKRVKELHAATASTTAAAGEEIYDIELAEYPHTDLGNAERFIARKTEQVFYCPETGGWFVWDGKRWSPDSNGGEVRLAAETVRKIRDESNTIEDDEKQLALYKHALRSESSAKINAILELAKHYMPVKQELLDKDAHYLNVQNGTVNLDTNILQKHDKRDKITRLANVIYEPDAQCPQWMEFIDFVFDGDETLTQYIQRVIGYAASGSVAEQCMFFLYGDGMNGKSTLLSVIEKLLCGYAMNTPTSTLLARQNEGIPNDVARLNGARFVTAVEADAGKTLAESLLKQLTGGDTVTARFMRAEFFQFRPIAKLFLAANHKPKIRGQDEGIWRRIKLIPFLKEIPEAKRVKDKDVELFNEAPGILNWIIKGYQNWREIGLADPEKVITATKEYREDEDWLAPFINEACVLGQNESEQSRELYSRYIQYCEDNKVQRPLSHVTFGSEMAKRKGIRRRRTSRCILFEGIRVKTASDNVYLII